MGLFFYCLDLQFHYEQLRWNLVVKTLLYGVGWVTQEYLEIAFDSLLC